MGVSASEYDFATSNGQNLLVIAFTMLPATSTATDLIKPLPSCSSKVNASPAQVESSLESIQEECAGITGAASAFRAVSSGN